MREEKILNYVHIFAGCGGLSLGLYKAGWGGLFAIEKNPSAFKTLKYNLIDKKKHFTWPSWLPVKPYDINTIINDYKNELRKLAGKVTLVAGGPPCQGFSAAGRRNEEDERNKLVNSYTRFVEMVKPEIIFFENVKGFTERFGKRASCGMVFSEYILDELTKLDYNVHAEIINFADFGIPQRRKRFILVGFQNGDAKYFFSKLINNKTRFLKKEGIKHNITVKEAISDLERKHGEVNSKEFKNFKEGLYGDVNSNYQKLMRGNYLKRRPDSHRFANHSQMINEKFNYILKNCPRDKKVDVKTRKDFNLRKYCTTPLDYNKPSPTLTTLPDDLIHYSEPRILTVREYARIQSFDDWYEFKGSYTTGGKRRREEVPRYTQIGNAIPPLFMNQVGEALKEVIW